MSRVKIVALSRTIVNSRAISSSNGDESAMKRSCQAMSSLLFFLFRTVQYFPAIFLSFFLLFFYSIRFVAKKTRDIFSDVSIQTNNLIFSIGNWIVIDNLSSRY